MNVIGHPIYGIHLLIVCFYNSTDVFVKLFFKCFLYQIASSFYRKNNLYVYLTVGVGHFNNL